MGEYKFVGTYGGGHYDQVWRMGMMMGGGFPSTFIH